MKSIILALREQRPSRKGGNHSTGNHPTRENMYSFRRDHSLGNLSKCKLQQQNWLVHQLHFPLLLSLESLIAGLQAVGSSNVTCSLADLPWLPCLMEGLAHPGAAGAGWLSMAPAFYRTQHPESKQLQEKSQLVIG